ncbi:lysosome membrane protein 2-like [Haliotis rubra]|uniref:lysosome membrane protein 2-like n=1 Tax=Haliotis rubra TaxID=36100 RepID=UPI001EE56C9D|nr:lysosome membrane protein 2-like [Haliotis rubra]
MVTKSSVCAVISCIFGVALVAVGGALIVVFKNLIHSNIEQQVNLKEGSETYNDWLDPPVPIYFQVWVLDIVNHEEVVSQGKRPSVIQKGPYSYRCAHATIPMLTIANLIRFEYGFIQELVDLVLEGVGERLFLQLSVSDIMWGYEDKLLKEVDDILQRTVNKTIDDHFGLFYNQNGSDDGAYNINTGVNDASQFAMIKSWNYNSTLPYWTSLTANMINGTDGTMFPPFVDKAQPLYLFSSDICRPGGNVMASGVDCRPNCGVPLSFRDSAACFSQWPIMDTVIDRGPVMMSQPHFLAADPSVINGVEGMHPIRSQHETFVDVEPMTGVAMNVAKKLQINVYVEPINHIKDTEKITPVFLPILWLNESAAIDEKSAAKFREKVQEPIKITQAVQYGLITLGAFILVCVLSVVIRRTMCPTKDIPLHDLSKETDPLLN